MALYFGGLMKPLLRTAALLVVSGTVAACSSMPDWVDPTTWIGGGDNSASEQASDNSSANTPTPDIAGIPDKPAPPSTSDEQKEVADSLEADRARAQYSADALRGGTAPAAAPPSSAPPPPEPAPPVVNPEPDSAKTADAGTDSNSATGSDQAANVSMSTPATTASANPSASAATGGDTAAAPAPAAPAPAAAPPAQTAMLTPPVSAPAAAQPASVVLFPNDAVALNAAGKAQVRAAAQAFQAHGGQGYVRVVGHSSSRTPNMPLERHLQLIFQRSQDRATAVARELILDGVPADKVLIEAVGDSQPVYYESMPQGEEGNRRAEIFLQS